ncbi:hypothetical protein [uncultured Helicobacter sp.]|uniref:hypothetical protein n=1 Tax=uncultured Helicobacter sp. TaxID=175537 RepID=UPI00374E4AE4
MIESKVTSDVTESKKSKALDSDNAKVAKRRRVEIHSPRAITICHKQIAIKS